jgi:hypothetical protein
MPAMLRKMPRLLLLATVGLACSARYEVGAMEPVLGGSGGSAGSGGSGPDENKAGTESGGSAMTAGMGFGGVAGHYASGSVQSEMCIRRVTPAPVAVLVTPELVWSRVSKFVWGEEEHEPPVALPDHASYEWAGELVEQAFAAARLETSAVPGANFFIRELLSISPDEPFEGDYDAQLANEDSVLLEVLLQSSWAPGHAGVFSEPYWLSLHEGIPSRGADISAAVFGKNVPAPPPNVNRNIFDGELTERQALEMATGAQAACATCHNLMNPLGYALGHFDRDGNYRELDHEQEIDTTGSYRTNDGGSLDFDGIADFGAKAAESCDANQAIVDNFLRLALEDLGYDEGTRESLITEHTARVRSAYVMGGRSYLALVKAYAQSPLVLRQ